MGSAKTITELVDEFHAWSAGFARAYADAVIGEFERGRGALPGREDLVGEAAAWMLESLPTLRQNLGTKVRSLINAARYRQRRDRSHVAAGDIADPREDRRRMAELQQAVTWAAEDRLTEPNRSIFLSRLGGKTLEEIAAELSMPVTTLHGRLWAIVSFLERVFAEQERSGRRFSVEPACVLPGVADAYPPPNKRSCQAHDAVTYVLLGKVWAVGGKDDETAIYAAHLPACPRCTRAISVLESGIRSALEPE